jgi:hypothetical protein
MALTYPQRGFAGAAVAGTLASPGLTSVNGAGVTFTSSTTLTGWTEIANGSWSGDNICVTFGYGTASEEKILCTFNSGTSTFTIVTRGYDGTSAVAHATGSLFILTSTATEAAELNAVTQSMKNLLLTNGLSALPADISTSAAALGTSINPASADHTHRLTASTLNGWLTASASGQLPAAVQVYLSSLNSGALPAIVTASGQSSNSRATDLALTVYGTAWTTTGTPTVTVTGYNRYLVIGNASMSNGSGASRTQVARLTTVVGSAYTMLPGTTEWFNPSVPTASNSSASITGTYVPASSSTSVTFALQAAQGSSATSSFLNTGSTITVIGFN